ncbi:MAG: hypothetical protein R3341_07355, partial [Methylophaga sp.]|nr:hypothetical protein [Methylophaga sp.]
PEPAIAEEPRNQQDELARLRERLRQKTAALKASQTTTVAPAVEPIATKPTGSTDDLNQIQDADEADNSAIDNAESFDSADWPQVDIADDVENEQQTETVAQSQPDISEDLLVQDDAEAVSQQSNNEPTPESEDSFAEQEAEARIIDDEKPSETEEPEPEISIDEAEITQTSESEVTSFDNALDEVESQRPVDTTDNNLPEGMEDLMEEDTDVISQQSDNEPTADSVAEPETEATRIDEQAPSEIEEPESDVSADEAETPQANEPEINDIEDMREDSAATFNDEAAIEAHQPDATENTSEISENIDASTSTNEAVDTLIEQDADDIWSEQMGLAADLEQAQDASLEPDSDASKNESVSADDFAAALAAEQEQAERERLETESQMARFEEVSQPPLPPQDELDDLMAEVGELQRQIPETNDHAASLEAAAELPLPDNASLNKLMQEVRQLQQAAEFKPVAEKGEQDLQQILSHIPRFGGKREGGNG